MNSQDSEMKFGACSDSTSNKRVVKRTKKVYKKKKKRGKPPINQQVEYDSSEEDKIPSSINRLALHFEEQPA